MRKPRIVDSLRRFAKALFCWREKMEIQISFDDTGDDSKFRIVCPRVVASFEIKPLPEDVEEIKSRFLAATQEYANTITTMVNEYRTKC